MAKNTGEHVDNSDPQIPKHLDERNAAAAASAGSWEVDALIAQMERELAAEGGLKKGFFQLEFSDPRYFTWVIVAFASMGGLLSGLDQSLISGANLYLPRDLGLTDRENSLVNAGMSLGAVGGALLLGITNEKFGRWWAIMIAIMLYTVGAALQAGAINYGMIIAGRLILGLGVGLEGGTVPVYVAETVERRVRGNLVSLYQFNIALGEVLGYAVAAIFLRVEGNWRFILGSSLLFSTIMGFGMLFLPESPRLLMHQGKVLEAFKVWKRIRGTERPEAREEFFIMRASVAYEEHVVEEGTKNKRFPILDLLTNPRARRALVYANIMIGLGQLTGVNGIMSYLSVLMNQIGFDAERANYMALVGGGSLLLGTIPAILLMEKYGRRWFALVMLPGFFIGLTLIGISYLFYDENNLTITTALYLVGLVLYMSFFGCYACLTWVVPSEVYPTYLRSYGMTVSETLLFLFSFIIVYNFDAMQKAFTKTGLMLGFFGGIAFVGWFYQLFFMPETKEKTLEEIDAIFERPTKEIVKENVREIKATLSGLFGARRGAKAPTQPEGMLEKKEGA
ncbi:and other transporter-domain-containing protein [Microdochium bolleyi]|uniref:And other transporter-domain-containing protein n=1 Tax=Microdochium bolleyi TaxID=196109 RepID=A0A136INR2_9PEZI|nr:and other transporter-domain-containing protein [Microdochium bolleyi]